MAIAPDLETGLIVTDYDPGHRELTAAFPSAHRYVVDNAEDRAALGRERYAPIVLDVMIRGEGGLTILR